jgi:hypothetical protein
VLFVCPSATWAPSSRLLTGTLSPEVGVERLEEFSKGHVEFSSQRGEGIDTGPALGVFDQADVVSMQTGPLRKGFLRQPLPPTQLCEAEAERGSKVLRHGWNRGQVAYSGLRTASVRAPVV